MKRTTMGLAVAVCLVLGAWLTTAQAADEKASVTGTWKWSVTFNDQTRDFTLKLKQEGEKVTGTLAGGPAGQDAKIEDGKVKDGMISFSVTRERNGNKFTTKYTGKLSGDMIDGKAMITFGDQTRDLDWKPKRVKEEK